MIGDATSRRRWGKKKLTTIGNHGSELEGKRRWVEGEGENEHKVFSSNEVWTLKCNSQMIKVQKMSHRLEFIQTYLGTKRQYITILWRQNIPKTLQRRITNFLIFIRKKTYFNLLKICSNSNTFSNLKSP